MMTKSEFDGHPGGARVNLYTLTNRAALKQDHKFGGTLVSLRFLTAMGTAKMWCWDMTLSQLRR